MLAFIIQGIILVFFLILQTEQTVDAFALFESENFPYFGIGFRVFLVQVDIIVVLVDQIIQFVINARLCKLTKKILNFKFLRYAQLIVYFFIVVLIQVTGSDFKVL